MRAPGGGVPYIYIYIFVFQAECHTLHLKPPQTLNSQSAAAPSCTSAGPCAAWSTSDHVPLGQARCRTAAWVAECLVTEPSTVESECAEATAQTPKVEVQQIGCRMPRLVDLMCWVFLIKPHLYEVFCSSMLVGELRPATSTLRWLELD